MRTIAFVLLIVATSVSGPRSVLGCGHTLLIAATGGEAIPADTAKGAWTTLQGPVIASTNCTAKCGGHERTNRWGTIVLHVPQGFEFNPDAPVALALTWDDADCNGRWLDWILHWFPVEVTPTTITVTMAATGWNFDWWLDDLKLGFRSIQVRPTASSPLASGDITESGTFQFWNLPLKTGTWGFLREVAGAFAGYKISGSDSGTAGMPVDITIQKVDQFGNAVTDNTPATLVFSGPGSIGTNSPTVNGSTEAFTGGIPVTFNPGGSATLALVDYKAETATVQVSDGTYSSTGVQDGLTITIAPGPASVLVFTNRPVEVTYGSGFDLAVQTTDVYGNPSVIGLGPSLEVTLSVNGGTGRLVGTVAQDIGTGAGNGTAIFTNLQIDTAGTHEVLASADDLAVGTQWVVVNPLALLTVKADDQSKRYGAANPVLTGSITGLKNNDPITVSYSTDAQTDSPAGIYNIVPVLQDPDNKLANYVVQLANGTLTISPGSTVVTLMSSENPTLRGSNITFTATVTPDAPAVSIPTGMVLFLTNGQPVGSAVALSAGVAALTTDQLPLWNTSVTAAYLGDANYLPATNSLSQLVRPPLEDPRMVSIVDNEDGTVTVTCHGTPAVEHYVQATSAIDVPDSWVTVSTNVADMWTGYWTYTDAKGQNKIRFYRAAKPY